MKPSILVIYYSQTGQLRNILRSIFNEQSLPCSIDFIEIKPRTPFSFPWKSPDFFDCMPESVLQIPEDIEPMQFPEKKYDLVVLGYQPWFLSPSIPINSFLKSPYASILKNQSVLTIIGARNMWLNAQEKIKSDLIQLGASLKGNLVFVDRNPNLISVLTIIRWTFSGRKEASAFLPEAGVQQSDLDAAQRFGSIILNCISGGQLDKLHVKLLEAGGVELKPSLIVLEKRGITNFRKFASFIYAKGKRGVENRRSRVWLFSRLLMVGIFILSPVSAFTAQLAVLFKRKKLKAETDYFRDISYREKAI